MLILPSSVRAACNDAGLYRNIMCGVTRLKLYHNVQDCQVVKNICNFTSWTKFWGGQAASDSAECRVNKQIITRLLRWSADKKSCHSSSASKRSIRRFAITEKAPTRAFSWLKAATTAFTFKTLLRHYAKRALTPTVSWWEIGTPMQKS